MNKININETIYKHISGTDGLPITVLRIEPEKAEDVRGIVQIIHGKNEHKGRYVNFMRHLAVNGYITIINDNRGHGESVLDPEDRGYWYKGGADALIEDLHEITAEVKKHAAEKCGEKYLPLTLLGHSMGSLAARCYIRKYDDEVDKLCIIGCPSKSSMAREGYFIVRFLELIEGEKYRSKLAKLLIMGVSYEFKFRKEHLHNAWTNSDADAVIEKNNDPLCKFLFTLNGYEEMLKLSMLAYAGGYTPKNPDMSIRFFSGEDDPCALSKGKLAAALQLLDDLGYHDIKCRLYPGMRHDILHEKNKSQVYMDILDFIEK